MARSCSTSTWRTTRTRPIRPRRRLRGGTLPYMAPEQLEAFLDPDDWGRVGAAADLYSLGLVMHELLSGCPPETPDASLPLPRAIRGLLDLRADFRVSIARHNPTIPRALEAIVARCLTFSPEARYPDASALADDLQRFLDRQPLRYTSNPSACERIGNWARRSRKGLAVVAVVLAALALILYQPALTLFVPVEHRAAFRSAVHDVDAKRDEAIEGLESLSKEYPTSPLVRFYWSVTLVSKKDIEGAAKQFGLALSFPGAEKKLVDWGARHPSVAGHAEALGKALLNYSYYELARPAFRIALQLDPKLVEARQATAIILEFNEAYPAAHALLSELIREAGSRLSLPDREGLVIWYRMRPKSPSNAPRSRVPSTRGTSPVRSVDALSRPSDGATSRPWTT